MGFLTTLPTEFSVELATILQRLSGTPASSPTTDKPPESQTQMVLVGGNNSHLIWRGDQPFVRVRFLDKGHWVEMLVHADPVQAIGFDLHNPHNDWQVVEMARCVDPLKRRLGQAALIYLIHHRPKDIAIAINQARESLTLGERQELDRTIAVLVRTEVEHRKGDPESRQAFVTCISDPHLQRNLVAASLGTEAPPRLSSSTGHKIVFQGDNATSSVPGASLPATSPGLSVISESFHTPFLVSASAHGIRGGDSGERPTSHSCERVIPLSLSDWETLRTARSVEDLATPVGQQLTQFVSLLPITNHSAEGLSEGITERPPHREAIRTEIIVSLLQGIALLGSTDVARIQPSTLRESSSHETSRSLKINFNPERQGLEITLQRSRVSRSIEDANSVLTGDEDGEDGPLSPLLSARRSFSRNPVAFFFARDERQGAQSVDNLSVFVPVNPRFFGYALERTGFLRPTLRFNRVNRADHDSVVNRTTLTEQPDGEGRRQGGASDQHDSQHHSQEEEGAAEEDDKRHVDNPTLQ